MFRLKSFKERDKIPGGLSDEKSIEEFDKKDLSDGKNIELEHTEDEFLAEEIASDHLSEDEDYYNKLKTIESDLKILSSYLNGVGLKRYAKAVSRLAYTKKNVR